MKVDNAIIMAAGTASRFAPLSYEKPKALIEVRGEVLIERQIRQLREAGIKEIVVVTGFKAEIMKMYRKHMELLAALPPKEIVEAEEISQDQERE